MKKLSVCLVIMMLVGLLSGVSFAEEKRVLRIGAVTDYTENFEKWDAIQRIKDELNIDIEFTYYTTDAYNAMLAGDALPDLMMGKYNLPTVIANKVAMNVRPYLEEYCPNALGDAYKPTVQPAGRRRQRYVHLLPAGRHGPSLRRQHHGAAWLCAPL